MVRFKDGGFSKEDHFFIDEDAARIYRGLKDLLVNEFDMDRIEEMRNEFSVSSPKDKIRLYAYKEKSRHTLIEYNLEFRAKVPKKLYRMDRKPDVKKARVKTSSKIISFYPGGDPIPWMPSPTVRKPFKNPLGGGLDAEHETRWHRSKFYKVLVSLWHDKLYSKEIHTYEEESEETVLRIHDLMREKFGAQKTIGESGRSHYQPTWGGE